MKRNKNIFLTILKNLGKTLLGFLALVVLFCILALLLPKIEVPAEPTNEPKTVEIFLLTNGVHTDVVMPTKTEFVDWSTKMLVENTRAKGGFYKYTAVGWGDKGFYLDTPTWADLKFSTAFKAAFWLSESAMHCTYYNQMKTGKDCVRIMISPSQYRRLIHFVEVKFDQNSSGKYIVIPTEARYGQTDAFYEAKGTYSFLQSCNTWVNQGLKYAGQKAALWTITDFGILDHYR